MPLITQSIPNLIGGVSQQAPSIRRVNQCEDMVNAFPSPVEGLVKRPPSIQSFMIRNASSTPYSNVTESLIKPHLINRDIGEKYVVTVHPAASAANCAIEVYSLDGTKQTVYYGSSAKDYLAGASRSTLKLITIADVTFIANTAKVPALAATTTTAINYDRIALVYIKQSNTEREYKITVTDSDGANPVSAVHKTTTGAQGTNHVAGELANDLNGAGPAGFLYTATSKDSVVVITRGSDFKITVEDDYGGQGAILIRESVQRFEDLPPTAPNNHVVRIEGVPESGVDDYYVKFAAEDGQALARGLWSESAAPNLKYLYDYATMPHILIRQSNGTFLFKRADGTTPSSPSAPVGSNYADFVWTPRLVGDDLTNSAPSFVGVPITNMVLFKNRLGFLSDENIILSETSEFFNFWRSTVLDIPDSDPIDVASSSPKIAKLKSGIVFNSELFLFTDSSQLVLRGGEILSPKSVALLPVGDYESYADIQPVSSGLSIFFGYNRGGGYTGVREMVPDPQIDGTYLVNNVSEYIPSYIRGKASHITATTQDDMAAVVCNDNLYMYKFTKTAEGILQAAWFRYVFPDQGPAGPSLAKVLWAEFIDSELYVLLARGNSSIPVMERVRIGVRLTDEDEAPKTSWVTHLDGRQYMIAGDGTYNPATGRTTWTLAKPYSYLAGTTAVYTKEGTSLMVAGGTGYSLASDTAGTVSVVGDYSSRSVWIGYKYEMVYQFSQFWLQGSVASQRSQAALQSGRYQLKNLSVVYEDTSFFKITVTDGENTYEYPYSGVVLASSQLDGILVARGTFRVPVYGRNLTTTVYIRNDSALPCKILSAEVEGDYVDRARRYA